MGVVPVDHVKVKVVHAHPVQAVHQVLLDEGGAHPHELLVQHALAVDQAVAALVADHDVLPLHAGGAQPAVQDLFALGDAVALAVVAAGVDHGAAPLHIQVHHLVSFGLRVQAEPGGAENKPGHGLVQPADVDIFHRCMSPLLV